MTSHLALSQTAGISSSKESVNKSRFYRPELDAIRFFLFLGVFVNHAMNDSDSSFLAKTPALALGIHAFHDACGFALSFFFFLSSYLITCLLQIEKHRTGEIDLQKFYLRRMLRLWPLYVGYLALISALSVASHDFSVTTGAIGSMLLFAGNWYFILQNGFPSALLNHLWSISVEEQFYVIFPFLTRRFSSARVQQGCIAMCIVALSTTGILVHKGAPVSHVWFNSLVQSIFFASGALFALRDSLKKHAESLSMAVVGVVGGLVLWSLAQAGNITSHTHVMHPWSAMASYAAADLGCACILWGALHYPTSLLPKPVVYLGRVAYGLYVFHLLMIYIVQHHISPHIRTPGASIAIELALTILIAILSYEFFEKPFLKLKHRFELVHSRTA